VENSSFTGEPEPVEVTLEQTDEEALHSKNLAFNSAYVVEGRALGIVVRTGDKTMIGEASVKGAARQRRDLRATEPLECTGCRGGFGPPLC
jgi:magnesium-transporting ATPase (P-type)